ncbi:MAG: Nif11-like leader peptide family RiPP precursor [Synergistaceae bacterium]|jgi:predicted ribosomally synthesized peptide with nif11-like leader|nr:Nif11-like leader peptide family RiPP precursor [Synergistaceae bacterium]
MSLESAGSFIKRVGGDKGFARCLDGVDSREKLLEFAKVAGYNFTHDELKHAVISAMDLSEDDLSAISGGLSIDYKVFFDIVSVLGC